MRTSQTVKRGPANLSGFHPHGNDVNQSGVSYRSSNSAGEGSSQFKFPGKFNFKMNELDSIGIMRSSQKFHGEPCRFEPQAFSYSSYRNTPQKKKRYQSAEPTAVRNTSGGARNSGGGFIDVNYYGLKLPEDRKLEEKLKCSLVGDMVSSIADITRLGEKLPGPMKMETTHARIITQGDDFEQQDYEYYEGIEADKIHLVSPYRSSCRASVTKPDSSRISVTKSAIVKKSSPKWTPKVVVKLSIQKPSFYCPTQPSTDREPEVEDVTEPSKKIEVSEFKIDLAEEKKATVESLQSISSPKNQATVKKKTSTLLKNELATNKKIKGAPTTKATPITKITQTTKVTNTTATPISKAMTTTTTTKTPLSQKTQIVPKEKPKVEAPASNLKTTTTTTTPTPKSKPVTSTAGSAKTLAQTLLTKKTTKTPTVKGSVLPKK